MPGRAAADRRRRRCRHPSDRRRPSTSARSSSPTPSARPRLHPTRPPRPAITPNVGPTAGGTNVTLTGTNFVAGTTVTVGGNAATGVSVGSTTSLTFVTPPGVAGPADVVVNNGGGTATLPGAFTYVAPPTATLLTPSSGPTAGGTLVTVTGTGFITGATSVTCSAAPSVPAEVNVIDSTTLTFTTPAHAAGPRDVTVTTAGGTSTPALTLHVPARRRRSRSLTPTSARSRAARPSTLTGTDFVVGQTSVTIGATTIPPAQVNVADAGNLTFTTPPGTAGPVDVVVATPDARTVGAGEFTYFDVPTLTSITPNAGPGGRWQHVIGDGHRFRRHLRPRSSSRTPSACSTSSGRPTSRSARGGPRPPSRCQRQPG